MDLLLTRKKKGHHLYNYIIRAQKNRKSTIFKLLGFNINTALLMLQCI